MGIQRFTPSTIVSTTMKAPLESAFFPSMKWPLRPFWRKGSRIFANSCIPAFVNNTWQWFFDDMSYSPPFQRRTDLRVRSAEIYIADGAQPDPRMYIGAAGPSGPAYCS